MKKILALIIAIMCIFSCTLTANAASSLTDSEGSMEVQYHSYSNYTIVLPESFDGTACSVSLLNGEIEEGYRVEVHATNLDENGYLPLTYSKNPEHIERLSFIGHSFDGNTWNVDGSNTMLCYFTAGEYGDDYYFDRAFESVPIGENWKPGDYSGILCYRVTCQYRGNSN